MNEATGERVRDPEIRERIDALVLPPAWTDVWICADTRGHIQAIGIDARGRKQYRYHDQWRVRRDQEKFEHMLEFATALPDLRSRCLDLMAGSEDMSREKVLAGAVRLLDLGFFRIGTEGYAEENQTYGLATIRRRHVHVHDRMITFDYVAKSGKRRVESVADPDVVDLVCRLKGRQGGGYELLAYETPSGWCDVKSSDINAFIREQSGGDFTAKDFRTWTATVLAGVALSVSAAARSERSQRRAVARAMQEVAGYLGNTPAVVRKSYVDPRIIDRFVEGATISLRGLGEDVPAGQPAFHGPVERAVLDLLAGETASDRLAA